MTNSYKQPGEILEVLAPYDRASSGLGLLVGSIFGMTCDAALSGAALRIETQGVHTGVAKTSAQAWAVGDPIYWDDTNKRFDNTAVGKRVGVATAVSANPSATGELKLLGLGAAQSVTTIAALTDNSGGAAADGTIAAVSDVATAANAIKELATKVNELTSKLKAVGIIAP